MDANSSKKIFVIIVTYKGHQWYERCFASLCNSEYPVQTIVIDNASNDGTVEYIRKYFPEIHLIESKENLGFGRANNIGMRYALDHGCDYVFLLNQDAWVEPNTLSELVCIHQKYPNYGLLSPMHMNKEKDHLNIALDSGNRNYELLSDFYCCIKQQVYTIQYVNAAAWLLPRKTLMQIGGFSPIFLHYGEDDDYLNRMKYHNVPIGLCPHTHVIHDHSNLKNPLTGGEARYYQSLLIQYMNLNIKTSWIKLFLYYVRQIIVKFLLGKLSQARQNYLNLFFLLHHIKEIKRETAQNKIIQSNWLDLTK